MASVFRRIIKSPLAPSPIGPYSQAVLVDRTLFLSGQIGLDPATGNLVEGGTAAQTKKALENIGHVLRAAGTDYTSVIKTTILMANMDDYDAMNNVYKEFFKDTFPARVAYQVSRLPKNSMVEIEAIAIVGPIYGS